MRPTRSLPLARAVPLAALTAIACALAPAAGAAVLGREVRTVDELREPDVCTAPDGTTYRVQQHDVGTVRSWQTFRGPAASFRYDEVWFAADQDRITQTYTNLETGRAWSGEVASSGRDVRLLSVQGTVQTYLASNTVRFTVLAPDGSVDSRENLRFEFVLTVDTRGTETPDDDIGAFVELTKVVGRTTVGDFCDDALRFTVS